MVSPNHGCCQVFFRQRAEIQAEFDDIFKLNVTRLKENRAARCDKAKNRLAARYARAVALLELLQGDEENKGVATDTKLVARCDGRVQLSFAGPRVRPPSSGLAVARPLAVVARPLDARVSAFDGGRSNFGDLVTGGERPSGCKDGRDARVREAGRLHAAPDAGVRRGGAGASAPGGVPRVL